MRRRVLLLPLFALLLLLGGAALLLTRPGLDPGGGARFDRRPPRVPADETSRSAPPGSSRSGSGPVEGSGARHGPTPVAGREPVEAARPGEPAAGGGIGPAAPPPPGKPPVSPYIVRREASVVGQPGRRAAAAVALTRDGRVLAVARGDSHDGNSLELSDPATGDLIASGNAGESPGPRPVLSFDDAGSRLFALYGIGVAAFDAATLEPASAILRPVGAVAPFGGGFFLDLALTPAGPVVLQDDHGARAEPALVRASDARILVWPLGVSPEAQRFLVVSPKGDRAWVLTSPAVLDLGRPCPETLWERVEAFDLEKGEPLWIRRLRPESHRKRLTETARLLCLLGEDEALAVARDDGTVLLLDPSTGEETRRISPPTASPLPIADAVHALGPSLLLSGHRGGVLAFFDWRTGELVATQDLFAGIDPPPPARDRLENPIRDVASSADGQIFAVLTGDGRLRVLQRRPDDPPLDK